MTHRAVSAEKNVGIWDERLFPLARQALRTSRDDDAEKPFAFGERQTDCKRLFRVTGTKLAVSGGNFGVIVLEEQSLPIPTF